MVTWLNVVRKIAPGQSVPYYARSRKSQCQAFSIVDVSNGAVEVRATTGGLRRITRANFEAVADVWEDYKAERIPRASVPTFNSSYILSLINLLEQNTVS